jgi:hypothetical protein
LFGILVCYTDREEGKIREKQWENSTRIYGEDGTGQSEEIVYRRGMASRRFATFYPASQSASFPFMSVH